MLSLKMTWLKRLKVFIYFSLKRAIRRGDETAIFKCAAGEKMNAEVDQEVREEETLMEKYYDKAKCFFDNISSDLKPRWFLSWPFLSVVFVVLCIVKMQLILLGEPPGQKRKSWTLKHLAFLVASWEAEDFEAVDVEPPSKEHFQRLVVGEFEKLFFFGKCWCKYFFSY